MITKHILLMALLISCIVGFDRDIRFKSLDNIYQWKYCCVCQCLNHNWNGGGDGYPAVESSHACIHPQWRGDNYCDDENNNAECGWDGGDCCDQNGKGYEQPYCESDEILCHGTGNSLFNYCNDYCIPAIDKNTGRLSCCDDEIWCADGYFDENGCEHSGNDDENFDENTCEPSGYCEHFMISTCQDDMVNWYDYSSFEKNCTDSKGESLGKASVCIPQNYKYSIKIAPKPPENNISIVISHIQVTEIAAKSCHMTIIFDLEVKWNDSRILLVKDKVPIFLGNEDQNQIWSPRFRIGKNLVSHNKQMDDELILRQYKNRTSASKKSYLSATFKCEIVFYNFPFDKNLCRLEFEDQENETTIKNITLIPPGINQEDLNYHITDFAIRHVNADATHLPKFEICIIFERNIDAIKGILINYHLMCATLVIVASINFVIDPIVVPGRAGLLVTVYLVLSTFFSDAQRETAGTGFNALTIYIAICMLFIVNALLYYGLILFAIRKISKEETKVIDLNAGTTVPNQKDGRLHNNFIREETRVVDLIAGTTVNNYEKDVKLRNKIIRWDRFMLIAHLITFTVFNVGYFIEYLQTIDLSHFS